MAFHSESSRGISRNPVIAGFILILGIAPIYPLYLQLRKWSALHAVFLVLVIAVLIPRGVHDRRLDFSHRFILGLPGF